MSENLMGLLMLGEARNEGREPFTPEKIRLAQTIGDSAAIAIRRMLLREQTERRLQQSSCPE
jgi:GAF domain-containing protein